MGHVPSDGIDAHPLCEQSDQQLYAELEKLRMRFENLANQVASRTIQVSSDNVHRLIRARAMRFQLFEDRIFADPAWDMLLHLYAKELEHQRVAVKKLCAASTVPESTALRHMKILERKRLIVRRDDGRDARRVWVELSPLASASMRRYFQWLVTAA